MPSDQNRDFAPIYRALADDRGVFADESDVVQGVIQHTGLKRDARILDVACGTGDVIKRLFDAGYEGVSGLDGSAAMIAQAANLGLPPSVTLTVCRW